MLTVDYIDVLQATADLCGLDRSNLGTVEFAQLRAFHNKRLATAWEFEFWPDLIRYEQRWFRPDYSATPTYAAGDQRFYPATQKYYQALRATTGNAPASAEGVTTLAYWADCTAPITAADYVSTTAYAVGAQVAYAGKIYQAHTATTGNLPTDTSKWGELLAFNRYVAYDQAAQQYLGTAPVGLGTVLDVTTDDPRVTTRNATVNWFLSDAGLQVSTNVPYVWVRHRLRCPILKGATWSSTAAYAVGQQVYYSETTVPTAGNFYDVLTATTAAQSPLTHASKFSVVGIPRLFDRYLQQGAFADWLKSEDNTELAIMEGDAAAALLADQQQLLTGQQGQARATIVHKS